MSNEFLNTREAAKQLKITIPTLHKLTHNGTIKGYKLGNRVRYTQEDLNNSLKEIINPLKPQDHE